MFDTKRLKAILKRLKIEPVSTVNCRKQFFGCNFKKLFLRNYFVLYFKKARTLANRHVVCGQ